MLSVTSLRSHSGCSQVERRHMPMRQRAICAYVNAENPTYCDGGMLRNISIQDLIAWNEAQRHSNRWLVKAGKMSLACDRPTSLMQSSVICTSNRRISGSKDTISRYMNTTDIEAAGCSFLGALKGRRAVTYYCLLIQQGSLPSKHEVALARIRGKP